MTSPRNIWGLKRAGWRDTAKNPYILHSERLDSNQRPLSPQNSLDVDSNELGVKPKRFVLYSYE